VLEERDDLGSTYGRVAIGILVVQDLAAVIFLAASSGKVPSPWALGLLALLPLRRALLRALDAVGHFFLSVGLTGLPTVETAAIGVGLVLLAPVRRRQLARFETDRFIAEERPVDVRDAEALVFGMGRVGAGAYDALRERFGDRVVGFDIDADVVARNVAAGRHAVLASATDADVFERLHVDPERVQIVLLAMSSHAENLAAIELLRQAKLPGLIAATARYPDEVEALRAAGADVAFHVLAEAGAGLVRVALDALARHNVRRSQHPPPLAQATA
jgi:hypothetical protein